MRERRARRSHKRCRRSGAGGGGGGGGRGIARFGGLCVRLLLLAFSFDERQRVSGGVFCVGCALRLALALGRRRRAVCSGSGIGLRLRLRLSGALSVCFDARCDAVCDARLHTVQRFALHTVHVLYAAQKPLSLTQPLVHCAHTHRRLRLSLACTCTCTCRRRRLSVSVSVSRGQRVFGDGGGGERAPLFDAQLGVQSRALQLLAL